METIKYYLSHKLVLPVAVVLGLLTGYFYTPTTVASASIVSELFISLLKLVSLPIIFLSIISTATGMESLQEMRFLGKRVIKYTILTTLLAASLALALFLIINPVSSVVAPDELIDAPGTAQGYLKYLIKVVPSNIIQPFAENNVIGVLILAMMLSFATLALPHDNRKTLHMFFSSLYAAIMKITVWIIAFMPLAVWAFLTLFMRDLDKGLDWKPIGSYLACVILANLIQALVVLPLFLKWKGVKVLPFAKAMYPALSVAFFSKSSAAALPMAVRSAESRAKISPKVAGFSLPLCTTINMNACAAYILITVLFVSMSNGITYSGAEFLVWILVATIAAIGNAGVPMGCFFLSSAFLAAMNVPLNILGVILPFYSLIDMLESAINVWSDSCVTAVVDREVSAAGEVAPEMVQQTV